jgi:hypothetical protein
MTAGGQVVCATSAALRVMGDAVESRPGFSPLALRSRSHPSAHVLVLPDAEEALLADGPPDVELDVPGELGAQLSLEDQQ